MRDKKIFDNIIFLYVVLILSSVILLFPQLGHSQSWQENPSWYSYNSPQDTPYLWVIYVQPGGQVFSSYNNNWFSGKWAYRWGVDSGTYQPEQNYNIMLNSASSSENPYIPYGFSQNTIMGAQSPSGYSNSTYAYPPSMEGFYIFSPYPGAIAGSLRPPEVWYEGQDIHVVEYIKETGSYRSQKAANYEETGAITW